MICIHTLLLTYLLLYTKLSGLACWGTDDNRNGCMDQIDFENDGLSGSLVPEMVNLNQLRFFILEQGTIGGPIPSEYGQFEKLLIFDLDFNDLSGAIPDELFNMNVLQQLDLNDNELDGTISTNIGSLKTLTFLQLDHNKLTGTIPTEVGELTALREFSDCFCVFLIDRSLFFFIYELTYLHVIFHRYCLLQ